jgi:hypothetical protein
LAALACGLAVAITGLFFQNIYNQEMLLRAEIIAPTFILGVKLGEYIFKIARVNWFKKVTYFIFNIDYVIGDLKTRKSVLMVAWSIFPKAPIKFGYIKFIL